MSEWQPIETAPKDGARVLLVEDDAVFIERWVSATREWWEFDGPDKQVRRVETTGWWEEEGEHGGVNAPDGWMPLPAPPSSRSRDER